MSMVSIDVRMEQALLSHEVDDFLQVVQRLNDSHRLFQQQIQNDTRPQVEGILVKLKSGDVLNEKECELLKIWIAGDAWGYVNMENNVDDWMQEYQRLTEVLAGYQDKDCSPLELMNLCGILENASRLSANIANYLQKKQRLDMLQQTLASGLGAAERDILYKLLWVDKLNPATEQSAVYKAALVPSVAGGMGVPGDAAYL